MNLPAADAAEQSKTRSTASGIAFAFAAAAAYGTSQVLTRHSVSDLAPPLVGAFLALFWGTLGFFLVTARNLGQRNANSLRGSAFFAAGGILSAIGVMLMFQALRRAQVVVISPVLATNPLFTLVFAALLLRDVERITRRVVIGALLVVCGVVVLTVV